MVTGTLRKLVTFTLFLSLLVVMLGAYTRLTTSGLGCPDWPGCYGNLAPANTLDVLEAKKAWTEMIHRYCAGTVGLLILIINILSIYGNFSGKKLSWKIPLFLLGLVVFQALLGMWTVTLKLVPWVVMGHLLGGILIFCGLAYLRVSIIEPRIVGPRPNLHNRNNVGWALAQHLIIFAIVLLFLQIALGGWVSANYAGIACIGFPTCNGSWWPSIDWHHALNFFLPIGVNYEGGILEAGARIGIQWIHRIGAMVVASYILGLSIYLLQKKYQPLHKIVMFIMVLIITQFILGVINVTYQLPLASAVLHNGCAALLLATMFALLYMTNNPGKSYLSLGEER